MREMNICKRVLGKTGVEVSMLGLGGEGVLRTLGYEQEASSLISRAIDIGITYFESARAYSGSESYYGLALKDRRQDIFLASKSHARDMKGAEAHLQETLRNMKTDHLDLWQAHDVRTHAEVDEIFSPGGAIEAFRQAKQKGLVKFIGVTGHHDPFVTKRCIETFPFDTVLMPVNPAESLAGGFIDYLLPEAQRLGVGIVGMKVYLKGLVQRMPWFTSMKPFLDFALSQSLSVVVIGCDDIGQLEENVRLAGSFTPLSAEDSEMLVNVITPYAERLTYYKPKTA